MLRCGKEQRKFQNSNSFQISICSLHPAFLTPECRYDKMMSALDCPGYLVRTPSEVHSALTDCLKLTDKPSLINVVIDPMSTRKKQVSLSLMFKNFELFLVIQSSAGLTYPEKYLYTLDLIIMLTASLAAQQRKNQFCQNTETDQKG